MQQTQFRDLTPSMGVEITGLDPMAALGSADACRHLRQLFDTRSVLVFRGLEVDGRTQANLVRMLIGKGPLGEDEPATPRADGTEFHVSNKEKDGGAPFGRLLFHSDMMWSEHTFQVLSLYGLQVEPPVPATLFASGAHAWTTLPGELRMRVQGMTAVQGHAEEGRAGGDPDVLITSLEGAPSRTTPVVLPHPRTGTSILYVSEQMTQAIEGLDKAESEALLGEMFAHLYRDDDVYEHDWRQGDLVAWDNIALQHARHNVTLDGPERTLRKVYAPVPPRSANPPKPTFAKAG